MTTLGNIIKEYRELHSMSMDEFSKRSGISKAYISLLERNKHPKTGKPITPSVDTIKLASDGMNMDFNDLFNMIDGDVSLSSTSDRDYSSPSLEPYNLHNMIPIPVLGCIPAGPPLNEIECVEDDPLYIEESWKVCGHEFMGLRVHGDSMFPKIQNNDRVIFRIQPDCETGDIVVARIDGENATLKKVVKTEHPKTITLQPINSDYDPIIFTGDDSEPSLEILVVVVQLVRDL